MPNIDERIVQMQFDNKQFLSGVKETIQSIKELKSNLELKDAGKGLEQLKDSADEIDFKHLSDSVDSIADHFTLLGRIGDAALTRLADKVASVGMQMVKSISIDQISAGMSKYEMRTKSVQTILAATGKPIETVEQTLDKLMKYTDETSYDFAEMASSIGKFTSVGVDLEMAEKAMEGIGNVAAKSGAGIQEANRAMYNFAQALATGSVKLIDWKSIENANMATKEFKEQLIATAIELGELKKGTTEFDGKIGKLEVDYRTFNSTLAKGWLTSDVLIKTLEKYSDTSTEFGLAAFKAAQEALTFTDALNAVKDAVSSGWMISFGYLFGNLEESKKMWTDMANAVIDFTAKIFEARNELLEVWHGDGGEASGYGMAIQAVVNIWETFCSIVHATGEAIANVFGQITGEDIVTATQRVLEFTEGLRSLFGLDKETVKVQVGEKIEDYFGFEEALSRGSTGKNVERLQKELTALGYSLTADGIFDPKTEKAIKEFQERMGIEATGVFDEITAEKIQRAFYIKDEQAGVAKLAGVFEEVEQYVDKLPPGLAALQKILKGVFSLLHIGLGIVKGVFSVVKFVFNLLKPIGLGLLVIVEAIADGITAFDKFISSGDAAQKTLEGIKNFFKPFVDFITPAFAKIGNTIATFGLLLKGLLPIAGAALSSLGKKFIEFIKPISGEFTIFNNKIADFFKTVGSKIKTKASEFIAIIQKIFAPFTGIVDRVFKPITDKIKAFFGPIGSFIGDSFRKIFNAFKLLGKNGIPLGQVIKNAFNLRIQWKKLIKTWKKNGIVDSFNKKIKGVSTTFGTLKETFSNLYASIKASIPNIGKIFTGFWSTIKSAVVPAISAITGLINPITRFFDRIMKRITVGLTLFFTRGDLDKSKLLKSIFNFSKEFAQLKKDLEANPIYSAISGFVSKIRGLFTNNNGTFKGIGEIFSGFITTIVNAWKSLPEKLESLKTTIQNAWNSFINFLSETFGGIFGKKKKGEPVLSVFQAPTEVTEKRSWFGGLADTLSTTIGKITDALGTAWDGFTTKLDAVKNTLSEAWKKFVGFVSGIFGGSGATEEADAPSIETLATEAEGTSGISAIVDRLKTAFDTAWSSLPGVFDTVKNTLTTAWNSFIGFVSGIFGGGKGSNKEAPVLSVFQAPTEVTEKRSWFGGLADTLSTTIGKITDALGTAWDGFTTKLDAVKNTLSEAWKKFVGFVSGIFGGSGATEEADAPSIETLATEAEGTSGISAIVDRLKTAFDTAWSSLPGVFDTVKNTLTTAWNSFIGFVSGIFGGGKGSNKEAPVLSVFQAPTEVTEKRSWFGELADTLSTTIGKITDALGTAWDGFTTKLDAVKNTLSEAWKKFVGFVSGIFGGSGATEEADAPSIETLATEAEGTSGISAIVDRLKTAFDTAWSSLPGVFDTVKSTLTTAWNSFIGFVSGIFGGEKETNKEAPVLSVFQAPTVVTEKQPRYALLDSIVTPVSKITTEFGGAWQEFIDKIDDIKENVRTAWNNLVTFFGNLFGGGGSESPVEEAVHGVFDDSTMTVTKKDSNIFSGLLDIINSLGTKISGALDTLKPLGDWVSTFASSLSSIGGSLIDVFSHIGDEGGLADKFIGGLVAIKERFEQYNIRSLIAPILEGVGIYSLVSFTHSFGNLAAALKAKEQGGGWGEQIKDAATGVGTGVLEIAAGVMVMVFAIKEMQSVVEEADLDEKSGEQLQRALDIIQQVFGALAVTEVASAALSKSASGLNISGALAVAAGVEVLVIALKGMIKILKTTEEMATIDKSLQIITALVAELTTANIASQAFSKAANGGVLNANGLAALALGVEVLVLALKSMVGLVQDTPWTKLLLAWGTITTFVAELTAANILSQSFSQGPGGALNAVGIAGLAIGVQIIVAAIGDLINSAKSIPKDANFTLSEILIAVGTFIAEVGAIDIASGWGSGLGRLAGGLASFGFAEAIGSMVKKFAEAVNSMKDVNPEVIVNFAHFVEIMTGVLTAMVALFGAAPVEALIGEGVLTIFGVVVGFIGEIVNTLTDDLSSTLELVGGRLKRFSESMKDVDASEVAHAFEVFANLAGVAAKIPVFGASRLNSFGQSVFSFGSNFKGYYDNIKDIEYDKTTAALQAAEDLAGMATTIGGITNAEDVAQVLNTIGGALGIYSGNLAGFKIDDSGVNIDSETISKAFDLLAGVTISEETKAALASFGTGGENDMNSTAIGIQNLATALGTYGDNIGALETEDILNADKVLSDISGVWHSFNDVNGIGDFFGKLVLGKTFSLTQFSNDIVLLGSALREYGNGIQGVDKDKVKTASSILKTVSNIKLDASGGLWQLITGSKKLGNFATNIGDIGNGLKNFGDAINQTTFDKDQIEAALTPIKSLAEVQQGLDKEGSVLGLLTGDKSDALKNLGEAFESFGGNLAAFKTSVSGMTEEDISPFVGILQSITQIMNSAGDSGLVTAIGANVNTALGALNADVDWNLVITLGQTLVEKIGEGVGQSSEPLDTAMSTLLSTIATNASTNYTSQFETVGYNIALGVADGIKKGTFLAQIQAANMVRKAKEAAEKEGEIESPSKVFATIGGYIAQGLAVGINDDTSLVYDASVSMTDSAIDSAKEGLHILNQMLTDDVDTQPVITPVLDLSGVMDSAGQIGGLFGSPSVGVSSRIASRISTASNAADSRNASQAAGIKGLASSINERIDALGTAISGMSLVMDSGALVGQIVGKVDKGLGKIATMKERMG